ncbi:MAG: putative quinol monooxygenase [Armatimonadota bacterium]|jgi:quinol monooxygenase YgiN|nr:antibiotic biosynthesis monooxygenase [candidate division WS1 bacterium]
MVNLIAQIDAKPGAEAKVAEALRAVVGPSRAESGCVSYTAYRSKDCATSFHVVETWKSSEALDAHTKTAHFQAFSAAIADAVAGPPKMTFLEEL